MGKKITIYLSLSQNKTIMEGRGGWFEGIVLVEGVINQIHWLVWSPHSRMILGSASGGPSGWSMDVFFVPLWVRSSSFPQTKNMQVKLIGNSILPAGLNDCFFFVYVSPVIDWKPVYPTFCSVGLAPTLKGWKSLLVKCHQFRQSF